MLAKKTLPVPSCLNETQGIWEACHRSASRTLHCVKDTALEASYHLDTYLCLLDDIWELSYPQEAVLGREQKEAVPTVERRGSRLHQPCLNMSSTCGQTQHPFSIMQTSMTDTSLLHTSHSKDSIHLNSWTSRTWKLRWATWQHHWCCQWVLPKVSALFRSGLRALDFSMSVDVVSSSHVGRVAGRTPCSLSHSCCLFSTQPISCTAIWPCSRVRHGSSQDLLPPCNSQST